ncbi:MAG: chorismate-binding protein [Bacteroidia bacterium]|nr:chorismate-binding protein [Bacteroidia bacterium]
MAKACYRIPGGETFYFNGHEEKLSEMPIHKTGYIISNFAGTSFQFIQAEPDTTPCQFENNTQQSHNLDRTISKAHFIYFIEKIQSEIKSGRVSKVVAARCKQIDLPKSFEINAFIQKLKVNYPNAYISAYQNKNCTFISASPELLISKNANGTAESVALAGTAPWEQKEKLGSKESAEQGITAKHIREVLHNAGILFNESDQTIVRAGHLAHLVNTYSFTIEQTNIPSLISSLHPTPAVGIYPHHAGIDFITNNEDWNRGFYAGYSGILNPKGLNILSINIRSMLISGRKALLQAGAGITLDSNPESEWIETEEKMQTLEQLL